MDVGVGVVAVLGLLLVVAAVAVVAAAVVAVAVVRRSGRGERGEDAPLPADVQGLRQEVAALRAEARGSLRHLAVVRYDAFPGSGATGPAGGRLSWSLALLDDAGDGVVLTSIHGRSEARSYAKGVAGWRCEQPLSPEESDAIARARPA